MPGVKSYRHDLNEINKWRELLDSYDRVYMTRSLLKQMLSDIRLLLRKDTSRITRHANDKRRLTIHTPFGIVHIEYKSAVMFVEYDTSFLTYESEARKEVEEIEKCMDDIIDEFSA